jgi:hypothetical protein
VTVARSRSAGSSRDLAVVLALVAASFVARALVLNEGLFHHDSVRLAQAVERSEEQQSLAPLLLHDPPVPGRYGAVLVNWLLYAIAKRAWGVTSAEPVLLVSAAAFGAIAVGLLYLAARQTGVGRAAAAGAALFFSLTPIVFSETVGAKEHGLAIALALGAYTLAQRAGAVPSALLATFSGLMIVAAGFVREAALLVALPCLLLLVLSGAKSRKAALVPFLVTCGLGALAIATTEWAFVQKLASVTGYRGFAMPIVKTALADLNTSMTPVGLGLVLVGLIPALRNRLAIPAVVWMLASFFYAGNLEQYSPRFLIETLAAASLVLAVGVDWMLRRVAPARVIVPAAVAAVALVLVWSPIEARHRRIGNKAVAEILRERTPEGSVVIAMDDAPFVEYYAQRRTLSHPIADPTDPAGSRNRIAAFVREVAGLISAGTPVYLLKTGLSYDPGQLVNRALGSVVSLEEIARVESEDFHRSSIRAATYEQIIWRLHLRETR